MIELRDDVSAALRAAERPAVTVVRAGGLGDTLLVLPVLELLRREAPGAALTLVGSAWAERLLPLLASPPRLVRFDGAEMTPLFAPGADGDPSGAFAGADVALLYTADPAEPLVENARRLCPGLAVHWPVEPPAGRHAAVHFASALARTPPASAGLPGPGLRVQAGPARRAGEWLGGRLGRTDGVVAVHPGSGGGRKCWPAEHFAQLARCLGRPVLLVEGPADEGPCRRVAELIGPDVPVARAAGLSVVEVGALLSRCALYVGNDSGVSHLAAALGAPTVAVFGPTDARVWRPPGRRAVACGGRPHGWPAFEQVAEACRRMLSEGGTA